MKSVSLLTVILSCLLLFLANVARSEDEPQAPEITEDWFVNGTPGDKYYNLDDVGFDEMDSDAYLSGLDSEEDREPTSRGYRKKKESDAKALQDEKRIYDYDVEDPLG